MAEATSVGRLRRMTPEQRAETMKGWPDKGRVSLAHLAAFSLKRELDRGNLTELAEYLDVLNAITKRDDDT